MSSYQVTVLKTSNCPKVTTPTVDICTHNRTFERSEGWLDHIDIIGLRRIRDRQDVVLSDDGRFQLALLH